MRYASLYLLLTMAVAFAGCARRSTSVTSDDEMVPFEKDTVLECKLEIKQDEGGILATVVFKNPTDHSEPVRKEVVLDEEPLGGPPLFVTKGGKNIPYNGMMVQKFLTKEDWRVIPPAGSFVRTIRVNDYYDLSAPGEYEIVCKRWYDVSPSKLAYVESNTVKFVVEK
jgi:hypothetical protein